MLARARDLVDEDPDLAEAMGKLVVARVLTGPSASFEAGDLRARGLLAQAEARRRLGDLEAAQDLLRQVRRDLPENFADPLDSTRLLDEEAELLAARGRYVEAAARACEALRESESWAVEPALDRLRRKIADWLAAADPPGGSPGPRRVG